MVLLAPFRRQAADIEDVFPEFRQGAACRAGRVRTAQDGPRLAPVQGASVNPVGKAAPVPVLAQGVDPVLPDQETPDRLTPFEPEQFRPVAGEDGFGVRGPVGVQVSARVPVHVRVHARTRGLAPDHLAVPVQVDPYLAVHGAGVQVPREPVREADGREPDVFLRRARVRAGGVRPPAGAGFVGASGGAGKQGVPDAGRRKEGEAEGSDEFAHILFLPKIAPRNEKQHKLWITCVVSVCILCVSYLPRENRRPASKSMRSGWMVRIERGWLPLK